MGGVRNVFKMGEEEWEVFLSLWVFGFKIKFLFGDLWRSIVVKLIFYLDFDLLF